MLNTNYIEGRIKMLGLNREKVAKSIGMSTSNFNRVLRTKRMGSDYLYELKKVLKEETTDSFFVEK